MASRPGQSFEPEKISTNEGKIIGIIAIKGGVGKTSCTANLGAALAKEFNKRVLLIDANFSAPNLSYHIGLFEPKITLQDVLKNKAKIFDAIHEFSNNLHIIPGNVMGSKVNIYSLKNKVKELKNYYDYILIDSSPNLNDEILATMLASDELYVITSPDYPTLSTTMRAVKLAIERKTKINGLILNRVRNKKFELTKEEIEDAAGVPIVGILPDDNKMLEAVAATSPVTEHSPRANSAISFNKVAASLTGADYKDPRFFNRIKDLFLSGKKNKKSRIKAREEENLEDLGEQVSDDEFEI